MDKNRRKLRSMPVTSVNIELTNHCNCKCLSCPQSIWRKDTPWAPFDRPKGMMPYDAACKVIDDAYSVSGVVNFSYFGEPMLHPEFVKIVKYAGKRNAEKSWRKLQIFSNWTVSTKEKMEALIAAKFNKVTISLDSATSETFDRIRAGGACSDLDGNTVKGGRFKTVCDKVKHWFSMRGRCPTIHEFVVSSNNVHELRDFVRQWQPLLGKDSAILTKTITTYGGAMLQDVFINRASCNVWKQNRLTVTWDGNVGPCYMDTNMDLVMGSIHNETLKQIFFGKKKKEIRALSKKRKIVPCNTCVDANNRTRCFVFSKNTKWNKSILEAHKPGGLDTVQLGKYDTNISVSHWQR